MNHEWNANKKPTHIHIFTSLVANKQHLTATKEPLNQHFWYANVTSSMKDAKRGSNADTPTRAAPHAAAQVIPLPNRSKAAL